jgi:hypothetical protein
VVVIGQPGILERLCRLNERARVDRAVRRIGGAKLAAVFVFSHGDAFLE